MNTLIRKNVFAFIKNEVVYFFTMTLIAAIMYAFDSMLFSADVHELCEQSFAMDVMLLISTGVIVFVNTWLIHYIMEFVLKRRSTEFAMYMLIGKKKREIFSFYCKEICYQACVSWVLGTVMGEFLKQFLMDILYHLFRMEYQIKINFNVKCALFAFISYIVCYIIALASIRKYFMKLGIVELLNENRKVEQTGREKVLFKKSKFSPWLLKNHRLFLYRTVTTKIRTMKSVIFITIILLSCSLVESTIAMFYTDYQNRQIDVEFPFSLMIYHDNAEGNFETEKRIMKEEHIQVLSELEYTIYRSSSEQERIWLYTHLDYFSDLWEDNDYVINQRILDENTDFDVYYQYDTFMKLSDYNKLRKMLGLPQKNLNKGRYIFQVKHRIADELTSEFKKQSVTIGQHKLKLGEICVDDFEQNGHNGADYIIVVSDEIIKELAPYYSVYTLQTKGEIPLSVSERMEDLNVKTAGFKYGSNHNILYASPILVKTEIEHSLKSTISVLLFPFAYISLVFLCTTMAVLSIRLLSDSRDYKNKYLVLAKLGMKQSEINILIHEQLALSYLVPAFFSFLAGGFVSVYINHVLIDNTGMRVEDVRYLLLSLLWIMVIYLGYFVLTDVIFRRNIFLEK